MNRKKIIHLLQSENAMTGVEIRGWVRTRRDSKHFSFVEINDGSCLKNLQIIVDEKLPNYATIRKLSTGSAVTVTGNLDHSKGSGQTWELLASKIDIIHPAPDTYPLQKKRHSDEFLRSVAHLRPRTNKYGATFRIRSEISYAIHHFFHERGFRLIHTPVITGSDCEGAGKLFRVTTLDFSQLPITEGSIDFSRDFFGSESNLTVSGQLSAEMFALALGDVYTFGPTFRAENSNTRRHVAEFWMVEPEMAFCNLSGNMDLAEEMIQFLISYVLSHCREDIDLFAKYVDKTLIPTLENIANSPFLRISYSEAIDILDQSKTIFEFQPLFGHDLQSEHERFLTEKYFKKPVIVYDYPKAIKPFYMRLNDDGQTVAAMDVLVPRIGEIIGGSQREERLDTLEKRMGELNLPKDVYWWYLDSRRFGSVEHSGFGLGFDRLIMLLTGAKNIRDVIPFPRTPSNIDF
jgi:asparaginyl-tRNA synthetase